MASASQGRGKAAYREFVKELNQGKRDILRSFKNDNPLSPYDIEQFLDLIYLNYADQILDENDPLPNPRTWLRRGEAQTEKVLVEILGKLTLQRFTPIDVPAEGSITGDGETTIVIGDNVYDVITQSSANRFKRVGVQRRNQVILPGDIEEYVEHVPYIIAIEIVYESGILKGFRLWVLS